jgi:pyridoxal phosphate enzyme (YggS family)
MLESRVMEAVSSIASNLESLRERVARAAQRAGRKAEDVSIVAVTKTHSAPSIVAAYDAGLRHFGENRVQEFERKVTAVARPDAVWHLIGHLQSNKARRAAHLFDRVDSVDSMGLAQKLDAAAAAEGKKLGVLIEVHLGDEATKTGADEPSLPGLAEGVASLKNLRLLGLMTIPPFLDPPEKARPYFRKLASLRDDLATRLRLPLPTLSMGMSHDFEIAIEEGATEIRPGTALFGARAVAQPAEPDSVDTSREWK